MRYKHIRYDLLEKIKRLRQMVLVSENHERLLREQWLSLKTEHEHCLLHESQLHVYLNSYAITGKNIPASVFSNKQRIVEQLACARETKKSEAMSILHDQHVHFSKWSIQYRKKQGYERLATREMIDLKRQHRKQEEKSCNDIMIQRFLKKNTQNP